MVVVRPPLESYILPPGLFEESFDVDTRLGRANLISILFNVVTRVNSEKPLMADLLLIVSGPVTYFYRPGGGISWEEIHDVFVHPLNLKNVGFWNGQSSLPLTRPLMKNFVQELEQSGFTVRTSSSSVTVAELGDTRVTIYNPIEIGYSKALWDVIDPITSMYIGSPEKLKVLQDLIAFFPDKRTTFASEFINEAKRFAKTGDYQQACRSLAGAAQVLGRIRLRAEIVSACEKEGVDPGKFEHFLHEAMMAQERLDALWQYHAGERDVIARAFPLEPVSITFRELEVGEFTALCRDLGIVCVATKARGVATVSLDKHDLEQKAGELGTDQVTRFSLFFEEVTGPNLAGKDPERLIRVPDSQGIVRYYDLRKE